MVARRVPPRPPTGRPARHDRALPRAGALSLCEKTPAVIPALADARCGLMVTHPRRAGQLDTRRAAMLYRTARLDIAGTAWADTIPGDSAARCSPGYVGLTPTRGFCCDSRLWPNGMALV